MTLNDAWLEYQKRLNAARLPASATNADPPGPPLAPSGNANFSGGLIGRIFANAGIDPRNPSRFAPPPQDGDLRGVLSR